MGHVRFCGRPGWVTARADLVLQLRKRPGAVFRGLAEPRQSRTARLHR